MKFLEFKEIAQVLEYIYSGDSARFLSVMSYRDPEFVKIVDKNLKQVHFLSAFQKVQRLMAIDSSLSFHQALYIIVYGKGVPMRESMSEYLVDLLNANKDVI